MRDVSSVVMHDHSSTFFSFLASGIPSFTPIDAVESGQERYLALGGKEVLKH